MFYRLLCAVVLTLSSGACKTDDIALTTSAPTKSVAFQTLIHEYYSTHKNSATYVLRHEDELTAVAGYFDGNNIDAVDFSDQMLIAIFLGERRSGGYRITITDIQENAESLIVLIESTAPGEGSTVTQALTSPFHLVKTATTTKPVIFVNAPPPTGQYELYYSSPPKPAVI